MKLIVNKSFGGFALPDRVRHEYEKRTGIKLETFHVKKRDDPLLIELLLDMYPSELKLDCDNTRSETIEIRGAYYNYTALDCDDTRSEIPGVDYDYTELEIIEIPDGYDYRIDDYDGYETVILEPNEEYFRKLIFEEKDSEKIVDYIMGLKRTY